MTASGQVKVGKAFVAAPRCNIVERVFSTRSSACFFILNPSRFSFHRSTMSSSSGAITCSRCSKGYITRQTSKQQNPMYLCDFELCSDRSGCGYFQWLVPSSHHPPGWLVCDCGQPCDYYQKKQVFQCYNGTCQFKKKADPKSLVLDHSQCVICGPKKLATSANQPSPGRTFTAKGSPTLSSPASRPLLSAAPPSSSTGRCIFPDNIDCGDADMASSSSPAEISTPIPSFPMPVPIITWISGGNTCFSFNVAALQGMELIFEPLRIAIIWQLPSPIPAEQPVIYTGFTTLAPTPDVPNLHATLRIDVGYFPTPFMIDIGRITQHLPFYPWVVYSIPQLLPVHRM